MPGNTVGRVATVTHDTDDLDGAVAFWTAALGLDVIYRDDTYVYLGPLSDGGPHLGFQRVPEPKQGKNRLHLDLEVPDRAAFAEWVVAKGGEIVAEHEHPGIPPWMVMADPQGNEFCIFEKQDDAA
jgi:catechol 2,3-dioxygenase-like lactoylglutathione lyase family enzyme